MAIPNPLMTGGPIMVDTSRRCDAKNCGAQGYWSTYFGPSLLEWCNHHFVENEAKLRETADPIIDHTWEMEF